MDAVNDPNVVSAALARETVVSDVPLTGVTVPHHILAADLIARGLRAASASQYDHILLIGPDHFRSLETPFGVLTEPFKTFAGSIPVGPLAKVLSHDPKLFSDVGQAPREHAVHAIAPFIATLFPGVPVTAIITATASQERHWDEAVELIRPQLKGRVLIVQSTDYSHFLPRHMAVQRDVETMGVIVAQDANAVANLGQPAHLDSKAAQYIQMRLQQHLGSAPMVIAHRDAHDYIPGDGSEPTTTYIVTIYGSDAGALSAMQWPDQSRLVFGGDVFLDRGWRAELEEGKLDPIINKVTQLRGPGAFVVNLEGVLLPERPAGTNPVQHVMLAKLATPVLQGVGVTAANTANNHAYDLGVMGMDVMQSELDVAQIETLRHGEIANIQGLSLLPLSFKRSYFHDHEVVRELSQLDEICAMAGEEPLVVLPHWGQDYSSEIGDFEHAALDRMAQCGVVAAIGAHTHKASDRVSIHGNGRLQAVFSMGNLLFDQTGDVSGALVELRRFAKGTVALRLIPIPNFYGTVR